MNSPGRRIQRSAMNRAVTCGLRHVQMAWNDPFQWLTPAGSGRQVRKGSTTLFNKSTQKCHTCEAERRAGISEVEDAAGCDKDRSLSFRHSDEIS